MAHDRMRQTVKVEDMVCLTSQNNCNFFLFYCASKTKLVERMKLYEFRTANNPASDVGMMTVAAELLPGKMCKEGGGDYESDCHR